MVAERIPQCGRHADHVLVVDVDRRDRDGRGCAQRQPAGCQRHRARPRTRAREGFVIRCGVAAARRVPVVEVAQLHAQHRGLQRVEARVHAEFLVHVATARAVHAQAAQALGEFGVVGAQEAPFAGATEVLGRIEREARDATAPADATPARVPRADRLRSVLDERHAVLARPTPAAHPGRPLAP